MPDKAAPSLHLGQLKLLLIPVLAVTLIALVWPASKTEVEATLTAAPTAVSRKHRARVAAFSAAHKNEILWNEIRLDSAKAINPFAPLVAAEVTSQNRPETNVVAAVGDDSLIRRKEDSGPAVAANVQAIHEIDGAFCAVIDGQLMRSGDTLPGGRRIAAITRAGVLISSK